jgi:hypothetical protein
MISNLPELETKKHDLYTRVTDAIITLSNGPCETCGQSGTGEASTEYYGFPCPFSPHQMLHTHLSSTAGARPLQWPTYQTDSVLSITSRFRKYEFQWTKAFFKRRQLDELWRSTWNQVFYCCDRKSPSLTLLLCHSATISFITSLTHSLNHGAEPFLRSRQLCSHSGNSQRLMEPESSLPCSKDTSVSPYHEPHQSNPYHHILSMIYFNTVLVFPVVSYLLAFSSVSYMHYTSPQFVLHALPI